MAERRLGRAMSARSEDAMGRLLRFEGALAAQERRFGELVAACAAGPRHDALVAAKNELAQMVGELDKLQMAGIDSVMTGDLESGKDDVRAKRKELTQRAEQVITRVKELHRSIVDHLAQAPAL